MISIQETEAIHTILIEQFGGSNGIRDLSGLESALARPFQTFGGNNLYPTPIHQAAALIESILINHPFIDGNKRTGYVMMRMLLISNGLDIDASQDEKYIFVVNIASGLTKTEDIIDWLTAHVK